MKGTPLRRAPRIRRPRFENTAAPLPPPSLPWLDSWHRIAIESGPGARSGEPLKVIRVTNTPPKATQIS